MGQWDEPSIVAMMDANELVNHVLAGIEDYKHQLDYMEEHSNVWGPAVFSSEYATGCLRYIVAYAELIRRHMDPHWYNFTQESVQKYADDLAKMIEAKAE
jgi:hypothetical protein